MSSNTTDRISTKDVDYLEQDEPIRNQNFVCLSFISPEDALKKKEVFYFEKYIDAFVARSKEYVETLSNLFPEKKDEIRILRDNFDFLFDSSKVHEHLGYFVKDNEEKLDKEFYEKNAFQTCIRGLKVRGTYDTLEEAKVRSERLRKLDGNKFSIYIAQVGCWCPWSPNPDNVEDQEFAETELNTLMSKYKENQDNKKIQFDERHGQMRSAIEESESERKKAVELEKSELATDTTALSLDDSDPWIKSKESEAGAVPETPREGEKTAAASSSGIQTE